MKIDRQKVYQKFNNCCGYCGRSLSSIKEMQVDHMHPKWMTQNGRYRDKSGALHEIDNFENLMPSCRRCNHYKRGDNVEGFRKKMITLHERIEKQYINKVAIDFGIVTINPFDGIFHFEKNKQ
jgi:5-methylcytosine-specific restriction endonuclease McrA